MTTKEKIQKSALKLFAEQGIDATSTREITKDVGVAEGTLYRHFKSKQDLIDTVYIDIKKGMFEGVVEKIDLRGTIEKNIKAIAKHTIEYFLKNYDCLLFMDMMEKSPKFSPAINEELETIIKPSKVIIEKWIKDGKLRDVDDELISVVFWDLIIRISRYCHLKNSKTVEDAYLDIIWSAVKR